MVNGDAITAGTLGPSAFAADRVELCWVSKGRFYIGSSEDDEASMERERPQHICRLSCGFWMGRYPVTTAHFAEFILDRGVDAGNNNSLKGEGGWPVAWVSWYEANEFCDWLTERWRSTGIIKAGWEVRLPSEAEWEKAARGGVEIPSEPLMRTAGHLISETNHKANLYPKRHFPWGDEVDSNRANYCDSGIRSRSDVGNFPSGVSPYGCEDMSGNVWEWTRTLWGEDFENPSYSYPYVPNDGREDRTAGPHVRRVLRGGAFDDDFRRVRCSFRIRFPPDERRSGVGFRVALFEREAR